MHSWFCKARVASVYPCCVFSDDSSKERTIFQPIVTISIQHNRIVQGEILKAPHPIRFHVSCQGHI